MTEFDDAQAVWDRRFASTPDLLFGELPNQWLARHVDWLADGSKVLCIADGEARNGVFLASRDMVVTSFDVSPVAIAKARALAERRRVSLSLCALDARQWVFEPEAFDCVVAIFMQFASPALRDQLFAGIRRTLRPGGVLIIEGYGVRQLRYRTGGPGIGENLYSIPMLNAAFPGWEILAGRDADIMLDEGRGHVGLSHSVAAVFKRPALGAAVIRA